MELEKLVDLYKTKNEIIIKRKKTKLDFSIKTGLLYMHDLRISVDDENLCVGKTKIKIKNLKRIYVHKECYKSKNSLEAAFYLHWLKIEGKNIITKRIALDNLSGNDLDKICKLFKHFIFSNEINENRLTSNNSNLYKNKLNEYTEEQKKAQVIKMNSKEYSFAGVLTKKYYKKYLKKDYLLFETKYQNLNYMDIWEDQNKQKSKEMSKENIIIIVLILLLTLSLVCLFSITMLSKIIAQT